ncbi:MAG: hypothetical protein ABIG60_03960 [Patescibacteria group bacterium]
MAEIIRIDKNGSEKDRFFEIKSYEKRTELLMEIIIEFISEDKTILIDVLKSNPEKRRRWAKNCMENLITNNQIRKKIIYQDDLWRAESEEVMWQQVKQALINAVAEQNENNTKHDEINN